MGKYRNTLSLSDPRLDATTGIIHKDIKHVENHQIVDTSPGIKPRVTISPLVEQCTSSVKLDQCCNSPPGVNFTVHSHPVVISYSCLLLIPMMNMDIQP